MNCLSIFWIILSVVYEGDTPSGISIINNETTITTSILQDTLKDKQSLYTGKVWSNKYRRFNGDQFLFASYFLPGTVSTNGKTYKKLSIRYDIYSDEIMIPVNREEIVRLNKEMIDSFTINFENQDHKFIKIEEDSLNDLKGLNGYVNVLYKQESALYIKYKKEISTNITEKSDGDFLQSHIIYLVKEKTIYPVKTKNDMYKVLNIDNAQIRNYLKNNNLKVLKNRPESFVPVIRFYDGLSK